MPATVVLASTTLLAPLNATDNFVNLASLTGIYPGIRLFSKFEAMQVLTLTGVGNNVIMRRGADGTGSHSHSTWETFWIARGDQLHDRDPEGTPGTTVPVLPWINVNRGIIWTVIGDEVGAGALARAWQPIIPYQEAGALGVRVTNQSVPGIEPAGPTTERY